MAELRSFIIGVTIAGAVLLVAGLAFGLFSSGSGDSPSVRLLGTPPATRTPAPAATRSPSELTPVPPTATSGIPAGETPANGTPANGTPAVSPTESPIQTATPTLGVAPTAVATPTPATNPVVVYVDTANQYTPSLVSQVDYLIGNVNAPAMSDANWRNYTTQSAQNIENLAANLASISAPACVSSAHGSLVAAANQASAAAAQVIAAINANDTGSLQATSGPLSNARDAINVAVTKVSSTVSSDC